MPIVGVDCRPPILHLSKRMVHIDTNGETIYQFAIGYIINPSLQFNNTFRTQVEKCLSGSFSIRTMKAIKIMMNMNTFIMELIITYENNGEIPK